MSGLKVRTHPGTLQVKLFIGVYLFSLDYNSVGHKSTLFVLLLLLPVGHSAIFEQKEHPQPVPHIDTGTVRQKEEKAQCHIFWPLSHQFCFGWLYLLMLKDVFLIEVQNCLNNMR